MEENLEDALQSVIHQTIGFKEHIQIILIDGHNHTDSEEICRKYKESYPENIVYIRHENDNMIAAKNAGIKYIQGKYVNFFHADDKWSADAFRTAYDFLNQHQGEIDFAAGRMVSLEPQDEPHLLDYKFTQDQIIDITKDYDHIQLSVSSTFISSSAIKASEFETELCYDADCLFINAILLEKCRYGILKNAVYF